MHAKGKLIINEFGNGFVNIDNNITIYINKKNLNNAFDGETVEIEYTKEHSLYFGTVINYSLINKTFIGKVDHFFIDNIYIFVNELGKSKLICVKSSLKLEKNNWLKVKIVSDINSILVGEIIELLPNDIDSLIKHKYINNNVPEINSINLLDIYNYDEDFSKENLNNYVDQIHLNTFTIDPLNSMDCDDAFTIENVGDKYNIYVHISDVSYYINPKKSFFKDVMMRGNTFYGKNTNWTMLPSIYSNNICSILPNKKTRVVTNHFIYNPNEKDNTKKLTYVKWFYSVIISKNKYDYDTVDNMMNKDNDKYSDKNSLNYSNQSNTFNILYESSIYITNIINDINICHDTKSHSMIKYWMIYVNKIMCNEVKLLYRYNPMPNNNKLNLFLEYYKKHSSTIDLDEINNNLDRKSIIDFISNNPSKLTFYLVKILLTKAFYSTYKSNETHYGIGISDYTHWTSPIRRSCDLLNHCALRGIHINDDDLELYIKAMNEMEFIQDNIEKFILEYNIYENIKVSDTFAGTIIGVTQTGVSVYIDDLDDKFTIHISNLSKNILTYDNHNKMLKTVDNSLSYKLFDKINIKVNKISINKIDFVLC